MYKIAVTGVGGGVGQSVLKSLQGGEYDIVALDGDKHGAGLYAAPKSYIIPYAADPGYIDSLLDICAKERCDLLFPGLDAELPYLSKSRDRFLEVGTTVLVSDENLIEIADNKWRTYTALSQLGIAVPRTQILPDYFTSPEIGFPLILKPMKGGARSKNVFTIKSRDQLDYIHRFMLEGSTDYVAQEYIKGDEYTCGSINMDGVCHGVITMRRILRDGDTYKAFVEKNTIVEECVLSLMGRLKPFGACNAQIRLRDNIPYVFEINARCSGTTAARALAGFNEPKMIADYLLKKIKPAYKIREISILRYWKEIAVSNERIANLSKIGIADGDGVTL